MFAVLLSPHLFCTAGLASELKLKQSQEGGLRGQGGFNPATETRRSYIDQRVATLTGTELQQLNNSNTKPNVEETVNIITNRLKERRQELGLPDSIKVGVANMPSPHTNVVIVYNWLAGWENQCYRTWLNDAEKSMNARSFAKINTETEHNNYL